MKWPSLPLAYGHRLSVTNSTPENFVTPSTKRIVSLFLHVGVRGERGFHISPRRNQQFLLVMSHAEFDRMSWSAASEPSVSARDRRIFSRQLHSRAEHGAADKQGRLVLPEDFCKQLGLKGEVALVGGRGRFEIWNLPRWKRAHEEETATYQHVANLIGL